jgi:hypothetical protein
MNRKPLDPAKCQTEVPTPGLRGFYYHQCTRKPRKDGKCKIHHPDEIKERERKREAAKPPSVWEQLIKAHERIAALTKENAKLRKQLGK